MPRATAGRWTSDGTRAAAPGHVDCHRAKGRKQAIVIAAAIVFSATSVHSIEESCAGSFGTKSCNQYLRDFVDIAACRDGCKFCVNYFEGGEENCKKACKRYRKNIGKGFTEKKAIRRSCKKQGYFVHDDIYAGCPAVPRFYIKNSTPFDVTGSVVPPSVTSVCKLYDYCAAPNAAWTGPIRVSTQCSIITEITATVVKDDGTELGCESLSPASSSGSISTKFDVLYDADANTCQVSKAID